MRTLPTRLYLVPARFDSRCGVCSRLVLEGDAVAGPLGPDRVWVHEACIPTLYRHTGQELPRLKRAARTPEGQAPPTHRAVNRADAPRCYVCGLRVILGRDGAPVTSDAGTRHAVCPPASSTPRPRPAALPCGHRAVYKGGPLKGRCRACTRSGGGRS